MITPPFELEQTDAQIIVHVTVPNVKMSEMEYTIVENVFRFYVKPYFLRLTFPRALSEAGDDSCEYDAEKQVIHFYLPKKERGAVFENLNMISLLLASGGSAGSGSSSAEWNALLRDAAASAAVPTTVDTNANTADMMMVDEAPHLKPFPVAQELGIRRPLIEVVASSERVPSAAVAVPQRPSDIESIRQNKTFSFDWEQRVPNSGSASGTDRSLLELDEQQSDDVEVSAQPHQQKYGFNAQYSGYYKNFSEEFIEQECLDLGVPETASNAQRKLLKQQAEDEKFNPDRFVADFMQSEDIQEVIKYVPRYMKEAERVQQRVSQGAPQPFANAVKWTDTEQKLLANLPKKEHLISDEKKVYLTMVDILFAYVYNHRTMYGENSVESVWTVTKLSSSLSWLEEFDTLSECITAFIRRVACYPLYRHVDLAYRCVRDVAAVLKAGREVTLRCLLETKYLLDHAKDQRYLLSKIFVDDLCVWLQREADEKLVLLGQEIERQLSSNTSLSRENLPTIGEYPLHGLEQMALAYQQEFGNEEEEEYEDDSNVDEGPLQL